MHFMETRLLFQHLNVIFTLFPCAAHAGEKIYDVLWILLLVTIKL